MVTPNPVTNYEFTKTLGRGIYLSWMLKSLPNSFEPTYFMLGSNLCIEMCFLVVGRVCGRMLAVLYQGSAKETRGEWLLL